jgi:hypothetical protein
MTSDVIDPALRTVQSRPIGRAQRPPRKGKAIEMDIFKRIAKLVDRFGSVLLVATATLATGAMLLAAS